MQKRSRV